MLLKEQVVNQQTISPHIHLRTIRLLSEQLRRHEDRRAYDLVIDLLLHRKPEIPQFVKSMISLLFNEHIIGFNVTMHYLPLCDKLQAPRELIRYLQGFFFLQWAAFGDDVLEVAIRAKFKYHGHIMFSEEAIKDFCGEEIINVRSLGKFLQYRHLPVFNY